MDAATLQAEFDALVFPRFDESTALALGLSLTEMARAARAPVVIDIRTPGRILYHVALPGSAPLNDLWVTRKSATALVCQLPSLLVGTKNRDLGRTILDQGLALATHADHGGAVPVVVAGTGVVACVTVSGLPQVEDHRLVVQGMQSVLATLRTPNA